MEQAIKAVEAQINLALSRGAYRNMQEAADAINSVGYLKQEVSAMIKRTADLQAELQPKEAKPNPIPKQSELKPVAGKK